MNKVLIHFALSLAVLLATQRLHATPENLDANTIASAYKKEQIIAYFDEKGNLADQHSQAYYHRKFLGKTPEGYYLLQNFYQKPAVKQSEPFTVRAESDFTLWVAETIEGKYTRWHKSGQKQEESLFINQSAEEFWTLWYKNGQKWIVGKLKNGKEIGPWVIWYENGQKKSEGAYLNAKREGLWTVWDENGVKIIKGHFKNGEKDQLWTFWHENGQKQEEGHYKNDEPIGLWTFWHQNGQKWKEEFYQTGEPPKTTYFNKQGTPASNPAFEIK